MQNKDFQFRQSAHGVVISPSGKLLVMIGSEWLERPDRSFKPDLPGGMLDDGESVEQGMIREIKEEAGLDIDTGKIELVFQYTSQDVYEPGFWHHAYFVAASTSEDVKLSWEHSNYRWVDVAEYAATEWRPSQKFVVDFLQHHGLLEHFVNKFSG